MQLTRTLLTLFITCSSLFITTGCQEDKPQPKAEPAKIEPPRAPELLKEDYKDPALHKMPRIQYKTQMDNDAFYSVQSVNIDGTEPRLTLSYGDPSLPANTATHHPSRSPNWRYLALMSSDLYKLYISITDLETGNTIVLSDDATGNPAFNWTSDSDKLYYRADLKIWEYTLSTKTTRLVSKDVCCTYVFLSNDEKRLLSLGGDNFSTYSIATGKELSSTELTSPPFKMSYADLSPNEQFAIIEEDRDSTYRLTDLKSNSNLWRLSEIEMAKKNIPSFRSRPIFLDNDTIIYQQRKTLSLVQLNIHSLEYTVSQPTDHFFLASNMLSTDIAEQ